MHRILAAIAFTCCLGASARGQITGGFYTGNDLYTDCVRVGTFCGQYVAGVFDSYRALADRGLVPPMCPPRDVTIGQMVALVTEHMSTFPEDRRSQAATIVIGVLGTAYRCAELSAATPTGSAHPRNSTPVPSSDGAIAVPTFLPIPAIPPSSPWSTRRGS